MIDLGPLIAARTMAVAVTAKPGLSQDADAGDEQDVTILSEAAVIVREAFRPAVQQETDGETSSEPDR